LWEMIERVKHAGTGKEMKAAAIKAARMKAI
jgi:hypothetical protein